MNDDHMSTNLDILNKNKAEASRIKKEFIDRLNKGEITFLELLEFAKGSTYSKLRRLKISSILSSREGWNYQEAKNALIGHGLNPDIRVEAVMKSKNKTERINALIYASPSNWGERLPAPKGWPWFGNILDTIKDLDSTTLPRELVESVRYEFGDDDYDHHYIEEEKDRSDLPSDDSEADDVLNDIFGDESEDKSDDDIDNELNDLLGLDDDDDDDEGDSSSDIFSAL